MVQALRYAALSGPTLVRLLAQLAHVNVAESGQSLSDQLSQWLGWTDAITLSTALNANPPAVPPGTRALGTDAHQHSTCVRKSLTGLIDSACGLAATARHATAHAVPRRAASDTVPDYAAFRQRYVSVQRAMETDIGELRGRLRVMLASHTPDTARLSAVDTVMEQALSAREHTLLACVPTWLGTHFERLRDAAHPAATDAQVDTDAARHAHGAWLDLFRKDMRSVLLAELDARFQPVEGLLSALRAR